MKNVRILWRIVYKTLSVLLCLGEQIPVSLTFGLSSVSPTPSFVSHLLFLGLLLVLSPGVSYLPTYHCPDRPDPLL